MREMSVFIIPCQISEVHCNISELFVNQRHIRQSCGAHRNVFFFLLFFHTVEIRMELCIAFLLGVVPKFESLHYLIERNRIKGLEDFQTVSRRKLHGLMLDSLKKVSTVSL